MLFQSLSFRFYASGQNFSRLRFRALLWALNFALLQLRLRAFEFSRSLAFRAPTSALHDFRTRTSALHDFRARNFVLVRLYPYTAKT